LFVVALRGLGTARTGAYFSVAPLFGVLVSLVLWPAVPGWTFWAATGLIAVGVWLHVRERHEHDHTHQPVLPPDPIAAIRLRMEQQGQHNRLYEVLVGALAPQHVPLSA
jgi:hypothetical protein